jgi:prepilin-type N-terminal cleavage/methylation domain-containing protein
MVRAPHNESTTDPRRGGFTLIEIVVALTIVAVIASVAIPTMKGLDREEKAAAPIRELAEIVQEVRQRAMKERRPYQIVFEREGIHACPFAFPIDRREEFLRYLEDLRTPPKEEEVDREEAIRTEVEQTDFATAGSPTGSAPKPAAGAEEPASKKKFEMPWTRSVSFEPESECSLLFWGDGEWVLVEGEAIRRWVFQATGMVNPVQVRLALGLHEFEVGFDPLTGEVTRERSRRQAIQP